MQHKKTIKNPDIVRFPLGQRNNAEAVAKRNEALMKVYFEKCSEDPQKADWRIAIELEDEYPGILTRSMVSTLIKRHEWRQKWREIGKFTTRQLSTQVWA